MLKKVLTYIKDGCNIRVVKGNRCSHKERKIKIMKKLIVTQEAKNSRTVEVNFKQVFEDLEVKVGDGATISWYSDKTPVTIIEIGKNYVKVQEDKAIRTDNNGMSDCQDYEYERNEKGAVYTFKKTRKGLYTDNGRSYDYGMRLIFGFRRAYYDYSF